jgi:hypothetical protein
MILTFAERYRQARLYAAQVRTRKAMGQKYEHAKPYNAKSDNRKLERA